METKPIKLKDGIKDMTIEEVYKQFEKFIYKTCQSWRNTYSIDDLAQVAFIGLNKAYESYDIKKDVLFLTYAAIIINNELKIYNRKERKHLNNVSMNNTFNDDDSLELGDIIHDDTDYEEIAIKNIECEKLKAAILKLNDKERKIIEEVSFNNKSQKEIAIELNVTQAIISRMYRKALLKLKQIMEGEEMPEAKITREQLVQEVRIYGTTRAAAIEIGNKYGLAPSTIRTYFDTMNVRKEAKKQVKGNINKTIINNNNEKIVIQKKTLVPVLFRGTIGEYEIQDKEVSIKFNDSSCVTLMKENILGLITELKELSEILA